MRSKNGPSLKLLVLVMLILLIIPMISSSVPCYNVFWDFGIDGGRVVRLNHCHQLRVTAGSALLWSVQFMQYDYCIYGNGVYTLLLFGDNIPYC
jgi:hypothetical protein